MRETLPKCPECRVDLIRLVGEVAHPYIYKEFSDPNTLVCHCLNCKVTLPKDLDALLGPLMTKETAILLCPDCKSPLVTRTEGEELPRIWYYAKFTEDFSGYVCAHCKARLPKTSSLFLPFDGIMGPSDEKMHADGMCPPTDYKIMEGWINEWYANNPHPNAEEERKFRDQLHVRLTEHLETKYGRRTA